MVGTRLVLTQQPNDYVALCGLNVCLFWLYNTFVPLNGKYEETFCGFHVDCNSLTSVFSIARSFSQISEPAKTRSNPSLKRVGKYDFTRAKAKKPRDLARNSRS